MECKSDFTYDSSCLYFHFISRCTIVISLVNSVLVQRLFCFWFTTYIIDAISLRAIDGFFVLFRRWWIRLGATCFFKGLTGFLNFIRKLSLILSGEIM